MKISEISKFKCLSSQIFLYVLQHIFTDSKRLYHRAFQKRYNVMPIYAERRPFFIGLNGHELVALIEFLLMKSAAPGVVFIEPDQPAVL